MRAIVGIIVATLGALIVLGSVFFGPHLVGGVAGFFVIFGGLYLAATVK